MTKPNWRVWLLMPDVKVWQACVLSIGLEPSAMDFERELWMYPEGTGPHIESESFPNPETEQQYKDLVEILSANLFDREYFSTSVTSGNGAGYNFIRLDEFATWATSKAKWLDLPPELAGLVANQSNSDSAQTQTKAAPVPVALTKQSVDDEIASLFDGVPKQQLAAMFNVTQDATNDLDLWTGYIQQANKNELENARTEFGKYNPYKAGLWWLDKKKPKGWTLERLNKRLAKNLPERSKGSESRLTGEEYN
jgi:hypothetical protein